MTEPQTPAQIAYEAWVRSKEAPQIPTPTPGQIAYEAYCESRDPWWHPDFLHLPPQAQQCWEAAAHAVLEQCTPQEATHE